MTTERYGKLYACIQELDLSLIAFYMFGQFVMETWRDRPTIENPHPKEFGFSLSEMSSKYKKSINSIRKGLEELVDFKVLQIEKRGQRNVYTLGEFILNKIAEKNLPYQNMTGSVSKNDTVNEKPYQNMTGSLSQYDTAGTPPARDNKGLSAPESKESYKEREESNLSPSLIENKTELDRYIDQRTNQSKESLKECLAKNLGEDSLTVEALDFVNKEAGSLSSFKEKHSRKKTKRCYGGLLRIHIANEIGQKGVDAFKPQPKDDYNERYNEALTEFSKLTYADRTEMNIRLIGEKFNINIQHLLQEAVA